MQDTRTPVTALLAAVNGGDAGATDRLLRLVYEELHRMAQIRVRREGPRGDLQPTVLVREVYLRLEEAIPYLTRSSELAQRAHGLDDGSPPNFALAFLAMAYSDHGTLLTREPLEDANDPRALCRVDDDAAWNPAIPIAPRRSVGDRLRRVPEAPIACGVVA